MVLSKEEKIKVLNYIENKCLNYTPFSRKTWGMGLRLCHVLFPIWLICVLFLGRKIKWCTLVFLLGIFILFVLCNGCILTMLELRFLDDNYTIADPLLELSHMEITNSNRKKVTYYLFGLYSLLLIYTLVPIH
jgi:hypothetical protein